MFETLTFGVVATAFGAGLRHGADWDHIAAIADIAGTQLDRKRSMALCFLYALGHAVVVILLGLAAIFFGRFIPPSIDSLMGRVVGITLIALGMYLLVSIARRGRSFTMRSRWMLLGDLITTLKARWRMRRAGFEWVEVEHEHAHDHESHDHEHPASGPEGADGSVATVTLHSHTHTHAGLIPTSTAYGAKTSFLVGMLHGIGAETPSQILIFVTAAGIGGHVAGASVLIAFVAGLLLTNTVIAAAASFGSRRPTTHSVLFTALGIVTGIASIAFGVLLLLNAGDSVPPLFG